MRGAGMRVATAALATLLAAGCATAQADALQRKERSEARLRSLGVPVLETLPRIEAESEVRVRTAQEVARRSLVLFAVAEVGLGAPRDSVVASLRRTGLWDSASPTERRFLMAPSPPRQAVIDASWRFEALWPLLWSLGHVEALDVPRKVIDVQRVERLLLPSLADPRKFVGEARLRPVPEILDETDLVYRTHWAVRQAGIDGEEPPAGLHPGVVVERHYALNWLTYYAEEWDDITTDT